MTLPAPYYIIEKMKDDPSVLAKKLVFYNRIIFLLSVVGLLIAIYVFQSFIRQSPIVCVNTGCEEVRKNPASYIYGIPVPGFGLVGYLLLGILSFGRTVSDNKKLLSWILGISLFGVLFVLWFTYTELFIIKAVCTWCAISTVNMLAIHAVALKSYLSVQ